MSLTEISEPYILLDFSQCYCGPCVLAAKEIYAIKDDYDGKVAFINISCDDNEKDWQTALNRDNITWPSLYVGNNNDNEIILKYQINSYPTFFLFGPDRTLLDLTEGYGNGMLDVYLKQYVQ